MARAHAYAEGDGPRPAVLELLSVIDRFGAAAVMGRTLGVGEIRSMLVAEAIVRACQGRAGAENWVNWAQEHPELQRLLVEAMRADDAG